MNLLLKDIKILKQTNQKTITLVQDEISQQFYIRKRFVQPANSDVYHQLRKLSHPAIPIIYDIIETEDELTIVEAFHSGTTLEYMLSEHSLSIEARRRVLMDVLSALECLHAQNPALIHRDVKPANVLVVEGRGILIDYDIARTLKAHQNQDTQMLGTQGYAAPEQYGFLQSDKRSDLYAYGVLMQEVLGTDASMREKQAIRRCLKLDPAQRFQSAKALYRYLNQYRLPGRLYWFLFMLMHLLMIPGLCSENLFPDAETLFENVCMRISLYLFYFLPFYLYLMPGINQKPFRLRNAGVCTVLNLVFWYLVVNITVLMVLAGITQFTQ